MPKKIIGYIPQYEFVYEIETEMEDYENFEEEFLFRPDYYVKDINRAWLKTNHPFIIKRYIDITTNEDFDISRHQNIYRKNKKYYNERCLFFLSYESAFLYDFYQAKKWTLFPNGYSGIYRSYYESGQLKLEFFHNNGEIMGEWKAFYPNGNIANIERKYLFNFG